MATYGALSEESGLGALEEQAILAEIEGRRRRRQRVLAGALVTVSGMSWMMLFSRATQQAVASPELFKQDPDGEVCAAFDQSADYSKCGRLEPAFFYWWARHKYGDSVSATCGQSASFAPNNPIPLSAGPTFHHMSVGNAWFVVCNYQALARLDEFCAGTFEAEQPEQEAEPSPFFGNDGLLPTEEDIAKGWTDPCAAHAFCSACDQGNNPYCKAYMRQRTLCSKSNTDYRVHNLFNATVKEYWCSRLPEIQAGTFEPHKLGARQCDDLFFS